jgi:hypothetical protein
MTQPSNPNLLPCETTALSVTNQFTEAIREHVPEMKNIAYIFDWGTKMNGVCLASACNLQVAEGQSNISGLIQLLQQVRAFEGQLLGVIAKIDQDMMDAIRAQEESLSADQRKALEEIAATTKPTEPTTNATTEKTPVDAERELPPGKSGGGPKLAEHTSGPASTDAVGSPTAVATRRKPRTKRQQT